MAGGESNHLLFGYETVFKTSVSANKVFGENATIRTLDLRNTIRRLKRFGTRNAVGYSTGRFEGALGIEFDLADPWFMKGVLGDLSTSGTNPYFHTFTEANKPPSMTIENGIGLGNTGSGLVRKYLGCIVADCRVAAAVGEEPAKVSLTVLYADETMTSGSTSQTAPTDTVYPFSMADFDYPVGTTIADTESVELTVTNNAALKWALGDRKASRFDMRARDYNLTTVNFFDSQATYLQNAYGASGTPSTMTVSNQVDCKVTLDNGQVSSAKRTWIFQFTKPIIERHSLPQNVEQENIETVEIFAQTGLFQCANATSTMP